MGPCCSCCRIRMTDGAFRHELSSPLLSELSTRLMSSDDNKVYIIRVSSMKDVPGLSDCFVELKIVPNDSIAGQQRQTSSLKPSNKNPKWDPPEKFQIISSHPRDARVIFSAYHYNKMNPQNSTPLGDAIMKLKDFTVFKTPTPKTLKLISPSDGKPCGEINITVTMLTVQDAMSVQEHCVYEFQRWNPVHSWGNTDAHLLPTDPGKWCTEDGKRFGKNIEDVAPPLMMGWQVDSNWHTFGTDFDAEGWQYSTVIESPYWYDKSESSYVVRRRTWHRKIHLERTEQRQPSVGSIAKKRIF